MVDLSDGGLLARRMLEQLADATADPPGVTRAAYGTGEQCAHDLIRRQGEDLGAMARTDAAGNLYLTRRGRDTALPAIYIGSHLDSVPHGGNYDGAAGVVAGLATMAELNSRAIATKRDLTVMAARAEEAAWFPLSYPGSQAALGRLPAAALAATRSDTGRSLAEHMAEAGFDPEVVRRGVPQIRRNAVRAFVEVHIEQGPRLLELDRPLALVTGISGGFRHVHARCLGRYAHSGAEPRSSRQDSVLGFSDFVQGLEELWDALETTGQEASITIGRVESDPRHHGGSRVLGEIGFTLDVRSEDESVLARLAASVGGMCDEIQARRRVQFDLGAPLTWPPAHMDAGLIERLAASADGIRLDLPRLSSGAGHDAAAFATAGIASAMIFIRNEHGSHNPHESINMSDLDQAVRLLVHFITTFDEDRHGAPS